MSRSSNKVLVVLW